MPKIKTHKATQKRFKATGAGKITHRKCGQDHFNARQDGDTKRGKRKDISSKSDLIKTIKQLTSYK